MRNTVIILFAFLVSLTSISSQVVFEDDFSSAGDLNSSTPIVSAEDWRSEQGRLFKQNGTLKVYQGTQAFVKMTSALGPGQTLKLTMVTDFDEGMFSRQASSGLSFFGNGVEKNFIGSPGKSNIWKLTGHAMLGNYDSPAIQSSNYVNVSKSKALIVFTYNYDTGEWKAVIGDASASGVGNEGVVMDEIRVGSYGSSGSITLDSIKVELLNNSY